VYEEERVPAAGRTQRIMRCFEERTADPATGVRRMHEQQEPLAVFRMNGRVADDAFRLVDRNQERVRRRMLGDELLPVPWPEHRPGRKPPEIGPSGARRSVEDRPDRRRIVGHYRPQADSRRLLRIVVHETPASPFASRDRKSPGLRGIASKLRRKLRVAVVALVISVGVRTPQRRFQSTTTAGSLSAARGTGRIRTGSPFRRAKDAALRGVVELEQEVAKVGETPRAERLCPGGSTSPTGSRIPGLQRCPRRVSATRLERRSSGSGRRSR
jgi:hypothetical protein